MKVPVSKIVLGTDWMIAVPNFARCNLAPKKRADEILHRAVEMGVNSFDTARLYWSEGVVGRFVRKHPLGRDAFWIISKGGHPSRVWGTQITRKRLFRELDNSLSALGTDYIDVHLLHYDDRRVPAAQIAEWSADLLRTGKVRNIGYSNVSLARLKEFRSHLGDVVPWVSNEFNAFSTTDGERWKGALNISRDKEYVDYLRENAIPFLAYSPLGNGDLKKSLRGGAGERKPEEEKQMNRLGTLAEKYNVPVSAIALNYVLQTAPNFHPVVRTSKLHHLDENMRALTFQMSDSDRDTLAFP